MPTPVARRADQRCPEQEYRRYAEEAPQDQSTSIPGEGRHVQPACSSGPKRRREQLARGEAVREWPAEKIAGHSEDPVYALRRTEFGIRQLKNFKYRGTKEARQVEWQRKNSLTRNDEANHEPESMHSL